MGEMREQGIATTFHYVPLHDSDGGRRFAARPTECPVSSDVSARLVRLPFFNTLTRGRRGAGRRTRSSGAVKGAS